MHTTKEAVEYLTGHFSDGAQKQLLGETATVTYVRFSSHLLTN